MSEDREVLKLVVDALLARGQGSDWLDPLRIWRETGELPAAPIPDAVVVEEFPRVDPVGGTPGDRLPQLDLVAPLTPLEAAPNGSLVEHG